MALKEFFCAGEQRRFPISELTHDAQGRPIHDTGGSCHFVSSGIPCTEPPDPNLPFREPHFSEMVYDRLPDANKVD